jgi:hypothetical protein
MPLGRYLMFIGSLLLALLFVSNWYFPNLSVEPARADVDRSIIRIHSQHKWPEAIVFDTTQPTIIPPPVETADIPVRKSSRDALALAAPMPAAAASKPAIEPKPVARKRPAKAVRMTARQPDGYVGTFPSSW